MAEDGPHPYIVGLEDPLGAERDLVGGKAQHLARMAAAGFPIPEAVVLTTAAYREVMRRPVVAAALDQVAAAAARTRQADDAASDRVLDGLRREKLPGAVVDGLRAAVERLLLDGGSLAVRSSGTLEDAPDASFSGLLTSIVGVRDLEALVDAVRRCWASAWRSPVREYAAGCGLDEARPDVAVVLQSLVPAERAGLIFTRDPVNRYARGIVVESTFGPAEDLVSGDVTPERYLYYPRDELVVFVRRSRGGEYPGGAVAEPDRHLSDAEVAELAAWGRRAEALFGSPQDLEWAYGRGRFWILQSRPLVFSAREEQVFFPQIAEETVLVHGVGASPRVGSGPVVVAGGDVPQHVTRAVVVLPRITNDLAVSLRDAAGVVADEGGATSHGANLLREFGVPAVISTGHGTERLHDGTVVTVDGFRGNVYAGDLSLGPQALARAPKTTMQVFASVLVPEKAEVVAAFADGVSSLRNDYFLLKGGIHPLEAIRRGQADELEETLFRGICRTAEIFAGKPLWYKTMDAPTDEFRRLAGGEHEPLERNPLLGWRGIGRELAEPEMLRIELRAVARAVAQGHERLGIKLPFIRFLSEFEQATAAVTRAGLRPGEDVALGVSVETPAVALRLSEFLDAGAAFVSVGVSDLTMCTLAVDRESHRVAGDFDPADTAVVELLEHIVRTCRAAGVFACATGESARNDALLPHLVRMRFDAVGVSLAYFAEVKERIHQVESVSG